MTTRNSGIPQEVERALSRRNFLRGAGVLVVGFTSLKPLAQNAMAQGSAGSAEAGPFVDPDFHQLDAWIAIHPDNTATFKVGKTDLGQGTGTAFRQMMADELDIAYDATDLIMGSTDVTIDQGGSGGSDAIERDGPPARRVAAEARRVLLNMASDRLGVPVDQLTVANAVISGANDPSRSITYGKLVGGGRFNVTLTGNNTNTTTGVAKVKDVQDLKIVGQSLPRYDIPGKVDGSLKWAVDVKVPGMVHARNIKPPMAGAELISVDESSVRNLPGFVAVVREGNYLAVVCEREEQAINAARKLKAKWQKPAVAPFPSSKDLFAFMRKETPSSMGRENMTGDPDGALARAPRVLEAEYNVPFQGHTAIGPAHAMADPREDQLTIYSNDMKSYGMRNGVAEFLGIPREKVRVVWMDGPQAYGRTAADDAGFEAAFLAKRLNRPVRVQWMREEETGWDTKGPAFTFDMRGGLDEDGNLVAYDYYSRIADYNHVGYNEPDTVLIGQLTGRRATNPNPGRGAMPNESYAIPNRRMQSDVIRLPLAWETPVRTGNLRDPNGPQVTFASESFIDELAAAAGADPLEFRMRMLEASDEDTPQFHRARAIACVRAAAERYGWQPRPAAQNVGNGKILTGRGIAYAYRTNTVAVEIAEVEVNRETGHVWVKRLVLAHDCGLVINPLGLERTVENGALHALSRALHEEFAFDKEKPLSRDWVTHPSLTHLDTPEQIDVLLVNGDPNPNRPDLDPYGAGETVCKPMLAAVGNAIYDATGVRIRQVPFRDDRVLAALRDAGVA